MTQDRNYDNVCIVEVLRLAQAPMTVEEIVEAVRLNSQEVGDALIERQKAGAPSRRRLVEIKTVCS